MNVTTANNRYGFLFPERKGVSDGDVQEILAKINALADNTNKALRFKPGAENQQALDLLTQCCNQIQSALSGPVADDESSSVLRS